MACVLVPLLYISFGYGWSVIVVWDIGACWLDRYWATYLYYCVFAVVVGFGEVDLVCWYEGNKWLI